MLLSIPLFAKEEHNIKISNCMMFLNNESVYLKHFEKACKKAKVSPLLLNGEMTIYGNLVYYYISDIGYISIMVNDNEAQIHFYCEDDSYDYEKFLLYFMKACYKSESPHIPYVEFDGKSLPEDNKVPCDFDWDDLIDQR